MVDERRGDDHHCPAAHAEEDDRRSPEAFEPLPPVGEAREEHDEADREADAHVDRLGSAHEELVRELRRRFTDELEDRLGRPHPKRRIDRDPGWCQEPDV